MENQKHLKVIKYFEEILTCTHDITLIKYILVKKYMILVTM